MSAQKEIEFFSMLENNNFWHAMRDIFVLSFPHTRARSLLFALVVIFSFHFVHSFFVRLCTGARHDINFGNRNKKKELKY